MPLAETLAPPRPRRPSDPQGRGGRGRRATLRHLRLSLLAVAALGASSCRVVIEADCDCLEDARVHAGAIAGSAAEEPLPRRDEIGRPTAAANREGPLSRLVVPVAGVGPDDLYDSFADPRSGGRTHRAIDIMAPRHTDVLAATRGPVARLFESTMGGKSIYQYDASGRYVFFYAHLEGYRPGLTEGDWVEPGETIASVGSSGNAADDAPHLHFAVYRLDEDEQWWQGEPINPYPLLRAGARTSGGCPTLRSQR
ncbi:MAG: M23 family peptidase [Acidobacteria bacterium]|nr:MAG: M23 family peptidase [Acidobacteriota bacterium]REK12183.1 MAG: M23 family peptidase [Acidobacteriota bacterium]